MAPKTRIDVDIQGGRVMKISKQFLIAGAMLCAITTTGAHAVTKCAALNSSSTTCTSDYEQYEYHTDWAATCTTNGVSTPISGTGICSSTGGSEYQTATELYASSTGSANKNCWCKMISPSVSRWVYAAPYATAGSCAQYCAYACAAHVQHTADFRSAMFGSLYD